MAGWLGAGLALPGLGGCGGATALPPQRQPRAAPLPGPPPRVAWVLSSGGPRGFVHVGVLLALDELGLAPELLVGSSVGALVGAMYAAGHRGEALRRLAMDIEPWDLADLSLGGFAGGPWLRGDALAGWVRQQLGDRPLESLPTRLAIVVQRLPQREAVAFTAGDTALAVQASTAIEGRFEPVSIAGQRYADPDLLLPLPVRLARSLGAQRVLALDASAHEDKAPPGTEAWRAGDLRKRALTRPDAEAADLVLHPDSGYYAGLGAEYRARVIEVGYRHTLARAERLRALHAR